jgi:hypothetical protein
LVLARLSETVLKFKPHIPQSSVSKGSRAAGPAPPVQAASARAHLGNQHVQHLLQRQQHLEELALDPGMAHSEWPRLNTSDRDAVVEKMRSHFGEAFAEQFLAVAAAGTGNSDVVYVQPRSGPGPVQLLARGYRRGGVEALGNAALSVEVWVHPRGSMIRRDISAGDFSAPLSLEEWAEALLREKAFPDQWMALERLIIMKKANAELATLCTSDPFNESKAQGAQGRFNGAYSYLRSTLLDLDMARVSRALSALFSRELAAALWENDLVREPCCEKRPRDPAFNCEPILGPPEEDNDE